MIMIFSKDEKVRQPPVYSVYMIDEYICTAADEEQVCVGGGGTHQHR